MMSLAKRMEGSSAETKWRREKCRKKRLKMVRLDAGQIAEAVETGLRISIFAQSHVKPALVFWVNVFTEEKSYVERRLR